MQPNFPRSDHALLESATTEFEISMGAYDRSCNQQNAEFIRAGDYRHLLGFLGAVRLCRAAR
jgi:hypothetical protein